MVGNSDDARLAAEHYAEGNNDFLLSTKGSSRQVYLINDVVYKVAYWRGDDNIREFHNRNRYSHIPGVRVPEMTLYDDVMAMEYIEGDPAGECVGLFAFDICDCEGTETDMPRGLLDSLAELQWDSNMGNAILRDGVYYLIDLA